MALNVKNYFYDVLPFDLQDLILNIKNEEERKDKERKEEEERKIKEIFSECIKDLAVQTFEDYIIKKYDIKKSYKKFSKIRIKKNGTYEINIILYFKSSIFRKIKCSSYFHFKKGEHLKMVDFWAVFKTKRDFENEEEEDENETDNENENESENESEDESEEKNYLDLMNLEI